jgi:hypothetical protein
MLAAIVLGMIRAIMEGGINCRGTFGPRMFLSGTSNHMIKKLRSFLAFAAICFSAVVASAMNNNDVIKMVKAGLDDETVILAIDAAKTAEFDTSANSLVELKNKGVSQNIIQAVLKKQGAGEAAAEAKESEPKSPPPVARIASKKVGDDRVLPPETEPGAGKEYFTRYTFHYEDDEWPTTNYTRGTAVPINTKVTLVNFGKNSFTLKFTDTGATLKIENVEKHSKRSIGQVAKEMLAETPTAIEKYGQEMEAAIKAGTLRLGMTKTQVLLTRGYPPGHETASLDLPLWKYWSSRFVVHSLAFDGDILTKARGVD